MRESDKKEERWRLVFCIAGNGLAGGRFAALVGDAVLAEIAAEAWAQGDEASMVMVMVSAHLLRDGWARQRCAPSRRPRCESGAGGVRPLAVVQHSALPFAS